MTRWWEGIIFNKMLKKTQFSFASTLMNYAFTGGFSYPTYSVTMDKIYGRDDGIRP